MKNFILMMSILILLNNLIDVRAQIPIRPNNNAPKSSQRIQPAAAEFYSPNENEPSCYYKYDAWSNETEKCIGSQYTIQTWNNTKGYPILLDCFTYNKYHIGGDSLYSQRTTLNANDVRTALTIEYFKNISLDKAGHVTFYSYSYSNHEEKSNMAWNGDQLATFKYDEIHTNQQGYTDSEIHIDLKQIEIVYQTVPFNAYEVKYYEPLITNPEESGIWINAIGTANIKGSKKYSGTIKIKTEVSADKKTLVQTQKIGDKLIKLVEVKYLDDNGSFSIYKENNGQTGGMKIIKTYNEYGDLIMRSNNINEAATLWQHEYDTNGRPLQVKNYSRNIDGKTALQSTYIFTAWHDGSSNISSPQIIPALYHIYSIDGCLVKIVSATTYNTLLDGLEKGIYLVNGKKIIKW